MAFNQYSLNEPYVEMKLTNNFLIKGERISTLSHFISFFEFRQINFLKFFSELIHFIYMALVPYVNIRSLLKMMGNNKCVRNLFFWSELTTEKHMVKYIFNYFSTMLNDFFLIFIFNILDQAYWRIFSEHSILHNNTWLILWVIYISICKWYLYYRIFRSLLMILYVFKWKVLSFLLPQTRIATLEIFPFYWYIFLKSIIWIWLDCFRLRLT